MFASIDTNTDDYLVKEGQGALYDTGVPNGEGVKRAGEYSGFHRLGRGRSRQCYTLFLSGAEVEL